MSEAKFETWNPVTGCDKVSAGCDNCYAIDLARKLHLLGNKRYQNNGDPRTSGLGFALTLHPDSLLKPLGWRSQRIVLVNSMSDIFHAKVPIEYIREIFQVVKDTPTHTYLIITKRARRLRLLSSQLEWPDNLWMGVSIENNSVFHRIEDLINTPAKVKFLSCEPLLDSLEGINLNGIDWVRCGGESGPKARRIKEEWARQLRDDCLRANVLFNFDGWAGNGEKDLGRLLDGREWNDIPRLYSPPTWNTISLFED